MLVDKDGKEVTPISCVHYSNEATVRYADGTTAVLQLSEIRSTVNEIDRVQKLRAVRVART
jgi:hypothetical protein